MSSFVALLGLLAALASAAPPRIALDSFEWKALVTGRRVAQWKPTDAVNPEELGEYYQGDILLTPEQMARNGLIDERYRWPNGQVAYDFSGVSPSSLTVDIRLAMDDYEWKTCLKFNERTTESEYIHFQTTESGCYSYVGMVGGRQVINYQYPGCQSFGTVQHEILHALGFHHQQSSPERDDWVTINWENIQSGREHNFDKCGSSTCTTFGYSYDYGSVMHYSRTAFSKNGQETITPLDPNAVIGQRTGVSETDIAKLNAMYNC